MNTENLSLYTRSDRHDVEDIGEHLPEGDAETCLSESVLALVIEAVHLVDRCALMIATQQVEVVRMRHLTEEEVDQGLKRLFPSIDVIPTNPLTSHKPERRSNTKHYLPEKQIGIITTNRSSTVHQAKKVVELTMNIPTDGDRCFHFQQHTLTEKYAPRLSGQVLNIFDVIF